MCGALKQYTFCVLHDMKIEFVKHNNKAVFFFLTTPSHFLEKVFVRLMLV